MILVCYNYTSKNRINSRGATGNSPRPDTRKGLLMLPHNIPLASNLKVCSRCGISKPATSDFFAREKRKSSGLRSICKECERVYRIKNKERIVERDRAYYAGRKEKAAEYGRAYHAANKQKDNARARKYRAANPERMAEYKKKWVEIQGEYVVEYKRAWRIAHKKRLAEKDLAWARANPEKVKARGQRRRARKAGAEGTHTAADIQAQYKAQHGKCYYCNGKVGEDYHVEHVIPLSRGGSNGPENIVIACPTCNLRKGDKLPSEWPEGGRLL